MKKSLTLIFITVCILLIVIGKIYYDHKIESQVQAATEKIQKDKADEKSLLDSLDPELNENQSVIDYLHFNALKQSSVTISVMGSSVAAGHGASDTTKTWSSLLEEKIKSMNSKFHKVSIKNHGVGGYSTVDLLDNDIAGTVILDNPDLVFFETSILNNHGQAISMDETKSQINEIVTTLKGKLPDAKIILISPNPAAMKSESSINQLGYSYQDYLREIKDYAKSQNWEYVDIYNGMVTKLEEENIGLNDISEDGIHPNDTGYSIWFEVLFEYISNTH